MGWMDGLNGEANKEREEEKICMQREREMVSVGGRVSVSIPACSSPNPDRPHRLSQPEKVELQKYK